MNRDESTDGFSRDRCEPSTSLTAQGAAIVHPSCSTSKQKNVTFPENSLVTVWPTTVYGSPSSGTSSYWNNSGNPSPSPIVSVACNGDTPASVRPEDQSLHVGSTIDYRNNSLSASSPGLLGSEARVSWKNHRKSSEGDVVSPHEADRSATTSLNSSSKNFRSDSVSEAKGEEAKGEDPVFAAILSQPESPTTFFSNLRKERLERADSIDDSSLSDQGWNPPQEKYFQEAEEYLRSKNRHGTGTDTLRPPSQAVISTSTERRYSAVVHQFMLRNSLVTPQPEGAFLARQADQARPSDPSYVSWAPVDQNHSPGPQSPAMATNTLTTFKGAPLTRTPDVYTPGSVISRSAESYQLKSAFTPGGGAVPLKQVDGRKELEESASLHNSPVKGISDVHRNHDSPASGSDGSCNSSGSSPGTPTDCEESPEPKKDPSKIADSRTFGASLDPGWAREQMMESPYPISTSASSTRWSPRSFLSRQVLPISGDAQSVASMKHRRRQRMRKLAWVLLVVGVIMIIASIIDILVKVVH